MTHSDLKKLFQQLGQEVLCAMGAEAGEIKISCTSRKVHHIYKMPMKKLYELSHVVVKVTKARVS